jgi:endonuclease YncB( thermonuclease family)
MARRGASSFTSLAPAVLTLLTWLVPVFPTPSAAQDGGFAPGWYTVAGVVDGETLRVRGFARSVRFAGVEADALGTACGDAAAAYLDQRVGPGSAVYLEPAEWDDNAGTDVYRGYARVEHRGALWTLQELLLMEGLVVMDRRAPHATERHRRWFEAAERVARDGDLGIWGHACDRGGGLRTDPLGGECPDSHPVKGDAEVGLYHVPAGELYDQTPARACFATAEAAEAWDYRRSRR